MANEYAVNKADLTAVADAIREKGGTADSLSFPAGFVEAVQAITTGGGSSSEDVQKAVASIIELNSEEIVNDVAVTLKASRLFQYNTVLKSVRMDNLESISGGYAFGGCTGLTDVQFPKLAQINTLCVFQNCTALEHVVFPSLIRFGNNGNFERCSALKICDIASPTADQTLVGAPASVYNMNQKAFYECAALKVLIIRAVDMIWRIGNVNNFSGTPIESGSGHIYVPSALIEEYKAATNWVTFADQFRALEDYTVDGTVTGELDEGKVNAA